MQSNDRASHGPWVRRLGTSIPSAGCRNGCEATAGQAKCQANTVGPRATPRSQRLCGLWLGSPQPEGLKPFVDFCGVARSGETAAGIAQHSRLQKSANALQRPSWDLISASLGITPISSDRRNPIREPLGSAAPQATVRCFGHHRGDARAGRQPPSFRQAPP